MSTNPYAGKRILVIDDEPDVVKYLETLLQDNGYSTVSAADGNQGLSKLKSEKKKKSPKKGDDRAKNDRRGRTRDNSNKKEIQGTEKKANRSQQNL